MALRSTVAVVISCYNLGRTLEEAVDSVLLQTRQPDEIVVVDDGSNDVATAQLLARLQRPTTRVVAIPHSGVAVARNHGVGLTSSAYLVLLDADDVLDSRYVERLGARLDLNPDLGFVSCAVQAFEGASYRWKPPAVDEIGTLTRGSVHVSSMMRRTVWDAVGGFDQKLPAYEDLDFWLRAIALGFKGEVLDDPLLFYRVRPDSRYRRAVEPDTYRQSMQRILGRHRRILEANGVRVLAEKEAFLGSVRTHRDQLLADRTSIAAEIERLDQEIAIAKGGLPHASPALPALDWDVGHVLDQFLRDRCWMIRGRVVICGDDASLRDRVMVHRWDRDAVSTAADWRSLDTLGVGPAAPADGLVIVARTPIASLDDLLGRAANALSPNGALLIAASAETLSEPSDRFVQHPAETWMRSALARVFPPETFDVEVRGGVLVTATVLPRRRLPRTNFPPRTALRDWPSGGIVLAYHRVAELSPDTHRLCISPVQFREHMRHLRQHYTVMPLVDLYFAAKANALPPRAVAVTLDDGYRDALTAAAPILVEEGVPATFFVNTERLGSPHEAWHDEMEHLLLGRTDRPPILEVPLPHGATTWNVGTSEARRETLMGLHGPMMEAGADERQHMLVAVRAWAGSHEEPRLERRVLLADEVVALSQLPGCDIGSHSEHHLQLPRHREPIQRSELGRAKEELERLIDRPVLSVAYPFGEYDDGVAAVARETPHLLAVTVEPGMVTASVDPMKLPRLEVADGDSATLEAAIQRVIAGSDAKPAGGASGLVFAVKLHTERPEPKTLDQAWQDNDRRSRDEAAAGQVLLTARPQFLIIDPTSRCNARCVMCPVSFRAPGDNGVDLPRPLFDKLTALLPTAAHVNLFSSGEPTIANDLEYFVDETSRLTSSHGQVWVSTNGKRLPPSLVAKLIGAQIGIQFSVDGGTKEVFESIRRGIDFDELCRSLALAQQERGPESTPRLTFSSTISKRNIHDLANIFDLAARHGIDHVNFYEEDPEVPQEEPFVLDETDRPIFEGQLPRIRDSRVAYSNGL